MKNKILKGSVSQLEDREKMLRNVAKDTVVSFKLEGIIISFEEAYKMVLEADTKAQEDSLLAVS